MLLNIEKLKFDFRIWLQTFVVIVEQTYKRVIAIVQNFLITGHWSLHWIVILHVCATASLVPGPGHLVCRSGCLPTSVVQWSSDVPPSSIGVSECSGVSAQLRPVVAAVGVLTVFPLLLSTVRSMFAPLPLFHVFPQSALAPFAERRAFGG